MNRRGHAVALLALAWLGVMYVIGELPRHRHFHRATQDGGLLASSPAEVRQLVVQGGEPASGGVPVHGRGTRSARLHHCIASRDGEAHAAKLPSQPTMQIDKAEM